MLITFLQIRWALKTPMTSKKMMMMRRMKKMRKKAMDIQANMPLIPTRRTPLSQCSPSTLMTTKTLLLNLNPNPRLPAARANNANANHKPNTTTRGGNASYESALSTSPETSS